jgi:hypothetical protein
MLVGALNALHKDERRCAKNAKNDERTLKGIEILIKGFEVEKEALHP